jgi:uncharacterized OB-fold protein
MISKYCPWCRQTTRHEIAKISQNGNVIAFLDTCTPKEPLEPHSQEKTCSDFQWSLWELEEARNRQKPPS